MAGKNGITDANAGRTNDNMTDQVIADTSVDMSDEESFASTGANLAGVHEGLAEKEAKRSIGRNRRQQ